MKRSDALRVIVENCKPNFCIISQLGRTSRDLYKLSEEIRSQCFYMMGAMGSVIPLTLGISIGKPGVVAIGLEGDGSLLMNLGSLVTLKRYGKSNALIIILNNGQYESTGGQISQPNDMDISAMCKSLGLSCFEISYENELGEYFQKNIHKINSPSILIIKTEVETPSDRIPEYPEDISARFRNWIEGV